MSLGIAFKGTEGIVLAADSRVTLTNTQGDDIVAIGTFDNATKLLRINNEKQAFVGAVTYGLGAIGTRPRTAHSFLPEFEAELVRDQVGRLTTKAFAERLSEFFMRQWADHGMPDKKAWGNNSPMVFIVAGYDVGEPYGRVYGLELPNSPEPIEQMADDFGATWGGQREWVDRLMQGFDPRLPYEVLKHLEKVEDILSIPPTLEEDEKSSRIMKAMKAIRELEVHLKSMFQISIPYQFLPLQDCVDLSIFLIRTTMNLQNWLVDIRGVGGAIDVATITKADGFKSIQQKAVSGERRAN